MRIINVPVEISPIVFRPRPNAGVIVSDADGYYIYREGARMQVIVIGTMPHSVAEIERALDAEVRAISILPFSGEFSAEMRMAFMRRLFIAIEFEPNEGTL